MLDQGVRDLVFSPILPKLPYKLRGGNVASAQLALPNVRATGHTPPQNT